MPSSSSAASPPYIYTSETTLLFTTQVGATSAPVPKSFTAVVGDNPCLGTTSFVIQTIYIDGNGWVTATQTQVNDEDINVSVSVDPSTFSAGLYTAKIKVLAYCDDDFLVESDYIDVVLKIEDADYIELQPEQIEFNHILGQALPAAIDINVESSVAWNATVSDSVLSVSPTSATGNALLSISLTSDINNVTTTGQHTYTVTVASSDISKTLTVIVNIQDTSGFTVTPATIDVTFLKGSNTLPAETINIFTDSAWTATVPAGVALSVNSGSGSNPVILTFPSINSRNAGVYHYQIVFTNSNDTKTVNVTLTIIEFMVTDIKEGTLHFAKSDDMIYINSNRDNTYIEMKFVMNQINTEGNSNRTVKIYNLPLFNRKGHIHPGNIISNFWDYSKLLNVFNNTVNLFNGVLRLDLYIKEKDLSSNNIYFESELKNIMFELGKRKSDNSFVFLTNNKIKRNIEGSDIILPFMSPGNYTLFFKINKIFSEKRFYFNSFFLNYHLNKKNNTITGDTLNIISSYCLGVYCEPKFEGDIVSYITFPKKKYHKLIYMNVFGMFESFDMTGKIQRKSTVKPYINKHSKYVYESQDIASFKTTETFKINTGWILPSEIADVQQIIQSSAVWLDLGDDEKIRLLPITKKLNLTGDFPKLHNFDLEFQVIENTNDKIYL